MSAEEALRLNDDKKSPLAELSSDLFSFLVYSPVDDKAPIDGHFLGLASGLGYGLGAESAHVLVFG